MAVNSLHYTNVYREIGYFNSNFTFWLGGRHLVLAPPALHHGCLASLRPE
jgi:hypothetical protein